MTVLLGPDLMVANKHIHRTNFAHGKEPMLFSCAAIGVAGAESISTGIAHNPHSVETIFSHSTHHPVYQTHGELEILHSGSPLCRIQVKGSSKAAGLECKPETQAATSPIQDTLSSDLS